MERVGVICASPVDRLFQRFPETVEMPVGPEISNGKKSEHQFLFSLDFVLPMKRL